jgi:hypothetical protein
MSSEWTPDHEQRLKMFQMRMNTLTTLLNRTDIELKALVSLLMKKGVNIDVDEWVAEANALAAQAELIRLVDPAITSQHEDDLDRQLPDDDVGERPRNDAA